MLSVRETQAAGELAVALYSPAQQRAPRGDPEGGRWVAEGAGGQMVFDFERPAESAATAFENAARAGRSTGESKLAGGREMAYLVDYAGAGQGVWKPLNPTGMGEGHSGHAEVESYRLAQLLGTDVVPPTVYSERAGIPGVSQQFIPGLRVGKDLRSDPDWRPIDQSQFEDVLILDTLIMNSDRNSGNWGLDGRGKLWAIDHGYAMFQRAAVSSVGGDPLLDDPNARSAGPRGLGGTSDLISYVNKSRMPSAKQEPGHTRANVADWEQARVAGSSRIGEDAAGKTILVPVTIDESGWISGWHVAPAKLARLRQITRAQVDAAIVGERAEQQWGEIEALDKRNRAANVWHNLQLLTQQGALTWW